MKPSISRAVTALVALGVAPAALAHHPLGGMEMTTFMHGMLSGVGHPLLGFDHLFFILLVGVAAAFTGRPYTAPAGYIGAMLAGCVLMTFGVALPGIEAVIALSLLVLGYLVLSGRALSFGAALGLFALAGLFHGAAFGGAMASAEAGSTVQVLVGYLLGLGLLQYSMAVLAGWMTRNVWQARDATAIQPRLAGAAVAGMGLFLSLEVVEGMLFSVLGLA
ncbi:HupE/UreJ family protein [Aquisalimonas lutea]|uniref:HupE/UreJ family protein n=1 Tax=Aquisalimonas lutea TaxID=1327750 RepID=UPI0025B4D19F|nr:HupE/UreJ family protein [Aquisalimonas lutea]MDN3519541.1 HupE/UreJ family protein [Aquisalimonas lutea]